MSPQSASRLTRTLGTGQKVAAPELASADFRSDSVSAPSSGLRPNAGGPEAVDGTHRSGTVGFLITAKDGPASVTVNGIAYRVVGDRLQGFSPVGDPRGEFHSPEVVQTAPGVYTFTLTYTLARAHACATGRGSDAGLPVRLAVSATENSGATTDTAHATMLIVDGVPTAVAAAVDEVGLTRNGNAAYGEPDEEQDVSSRDRAGGAPASRFSYINQSGQAVWKEIPQAKPGNPNPSVTISDLKGGGSLTIHKDGTYYFTAAQQPATVAPVSTVAGVQFGAASSANGYAFFTVADTIVADRDEGLAAGAWPPVVFTPSPDDIAGGIAALHDSRPAAGHHEGFVERGAPQLDLMHKGTDADAPAPTPSLGHDESDSGMGGAAGEGEHSGLQEALTPVERARAADYDKTREGADTGIPANEAAGEGLKPSVGHEHSADELGRGDTCCGGGYFDGGIGDGCFADDGDTLMYGNTGDDILYGGAGRDVFVWRVGDAGGGNDTVLDFNLYEDKLNFVSLFGNDTHGEISEADILLALEGGTIDLTAGDATHLHLTVRAGCWAQQVGLTLEGSALSADQLDAFHLSLQAGIGADTEKAALLHLLLTNLGG